MACPSDEALPWVGADLERFAATWCLGSLLATVYRVDHVSHGESMAPVVGLELSLEKVAPGPGKLLQAQGSEPVHSATPGSAGDEPRFTCSVVPAPTFWRPRPLSPCPRAPRFRTPWGLEHSGSASGTRSFPCRSTPVKDGSERSSVPRVRLEQDACSKPRGVVSWAFMAFWGHGVRPRGSLEVPRELWGHKPRWGQPAQLCLPLYLGAGTDGPGSLFCSPRHLSLRTVGLETLRGRVTGGVLTPSDPADVAAGEQGGMMGGGGFGPGAFFLRRI